MLLVNPSPVYSIVNVTMLLRPFHAHHTSCVVLGPYLSTCIYVVSNVRCAFILNKFSCSVETWYLGIFVFPVKKVSSSRRITFFPFLSFFTTNKRAKSRNIFSLWCRREREREMFVPFFLDDDDDSSRLGECKYEWFRNRIQNRIELTLIWLI